MLNEIQKLDYDRYLTLIFADKALRDDLLSVILFNLEIARIKSRVTEPMIGLIRLEWWREGVEEAFDSARVMKQHDIVKKLRGLAGSYKLDKNDFHTIINARAKDLEQTPFNTITEFNEYVLNTSFPLNKIMLDMLGVTDANIIAATKEISKAWAICAIIRSAYKNYSAGRSVFPQDLAQKYNVVISQLGKDEFLKNSKELVKELTEMAAEQIKVAEQILTSVSKQNKKVALPVLLNIVSVKNHIKQIRRNKYDAFTRTLNPYLGVGGLLRIYIKGV